MTKVNLDKLQATTNGNIETIIAEVDLGNGTLITLGEAVEGNREAIKAIAPDTTKELLLVAHPEVKYSENDPDELDYTSKAGKATRAYHLTVGDKFQVERSLFTAPPTKGDIVTADPATFGYAAGSGQTTFLVERLTTFDFDAREMALLRVLTV